MEIRLLGVLEVHDGERMIALPRRQQRALLAALALRAGEVVSTERLIADLWGERAPASARGSLQNTVSALRETLGRDVVLTQAPGYRLALDPESVDAHRFERLLTAARGADALARAPILTEALALWRGPALADLDEEEFARREAARLDELRVAALEERIDAELALGRHATLVGELETLVAAHPLRERLRGQLMVTLYRCGRQAEALGAYRAARRALADELGLDPSPELQELERKVLRQDPELAAPPEVTEGAPPREISELRLVSVLAAIPPAADDPEQHRRLLDDALASVRDVLDRYGGMLERFGPEGLVAVFGADGPADDDAIRAVTSARELGFPAGVATGEMVQGAGAVVSRAVELARAGGLRVDERTAALVQDERRLDAPLVGREEELARLRAALAAVRKTSRCHVVTVVGEPGIGKTRLARELALREGGQTMVLVARCLAHGDGTTFLPLLGALREVEPEQALAEEPDGELVRARLGALAEGGQSAPLGELYWAIRRLFEALAGAQPVLLVLDDVHWAEPALVDLIDYLGDRAAAPLLVLCLARPELERPLGEALALGPLGETEARAIVAGTADLDEETRERIVELAEGNPLYVEQLTSFAAEGGEGLPPTLEAVLAGRLGRLAPAERGVLQRAAVVGREFSLGAVASLTQGEVARSLLALSRAGFVHPAATPDPGDDGYTFHHVLLRDAAYSTLTKSDRADLHERAAAWLDREGAGDDALVGYHLEQAAQYRRELGESVDELAANAGERLGEAGMRAWRQNDTRAAVGLLRRATTLLPAGTRRAELLCELALAELNAGERGDALMRAAEDARATGSDRVSARVAVERAAADFRDGGISAAELLETAFGSIDVLTTAGDDRALGRAWLAVSDVHQWACRYGDAEEAARMASASYSSASFSPAPIDAVLTNCLVFGPTSVRDAIRQCEDLRDAAPDRLSAANVTTSLAALAALEGRFADARALCSHALEIYEDLGSVRTVNAVWRPNALLVERRAGDLEAAAAIARDTTRYFEQRGDRAYASTWAARQAEVLYWSGHHEEADRSVEAAREGAVVHDVYVQFLWRSAGAKLAARDGRAEEADRLSTEALRLAAASDSPLLLADLWLARAEVLRLGGRAAEAAETAKRARSLLRQKGDTAGVAEIGRLLSRRQTKSPSGLSV